MAFRFLIIPTIILAGIAASAQVPVSMNFRASSAVGVTAVSTGVSAAVIRSMERDAFELINSERSHAGLPQLHWSDKVADVARYHSNNMAERNFFSHQGLDGAFVDERAAKLNMGRWSAIGENIAFMKGFDNPVEIAVQQWLQSPGHKRNLLNPDWTETAIGLAVSADGKYYFTQVFIR